RSNRENLRTLLHSPTAPALRTEFGPGAVHLQAYHRGAWRPHPGGEPRSIGYGGRARGARRTFHGAAAGHVMAAETPTVHASAVLAGARGVLIRGPAGSGKSQLALALILAAETGLLRFARLIGDDRLHLEVHHGRLVVRPAATLAGLIEGRGLRIRPPAYEPGAGVGLLGGPATGGREGMATTRDAGR